MLSTMVNGVLSLIPNVDVLSENQAVYAYMTCNTLKDFCTTGSAIVSTLPTGKGYPSTEYLDFLSSAISELYPSDLFYDTEEGQQVNEDKLGNPEDSQNAYKLYRVIKNNIVSLEKYIRARDDDWILSNFDAIFNGLPDTFKKTLEGFKYLASSKDVSSEHKDIIWDYIEILLDLSLEDA